MKVNSTREARVSVIDSVLSSQAELGPKIPDGGYGWVVFTATLFFHIFIPSLIVVYGLFLAAAKLNTDISSDETLYLWNDKLTYVPLTFIMSWTLFDPVARNLISQTCWPRVFGQAGNCLTCAGLLFVWMGMAGKNNLILNDKIWLVMAGLITGIGSSIQVAQCEIVLAQYFKLKHRCLTHVSHAVVALGFVVTPNLVAQLRMKFSLLNVVLIYQAILLLAVVMTMAFRRPEYLKSKLIRYHYVMENAEDEEDIFSKSLTELKVKTKDVLKRIELKNNTILNEATISTSDEHDDKTKIERKSWVKFNDDEKSSERFEKSIHQKVEEDDTSHGKYVSLGDSSNLPTPLFNESRVNMNNTYAFDDDNMETGPKSVPSVFLQAESTSRINIFSYLKILKMPTLFKSLLTIITTKYSFFIFYSLFPAYFYVQVAHLKFMKSAILVGAVSLGAIVFSVLSYWLNITKQRRPVVLFMLCWIGANGYFLIATYKNNIYFVIFGAVEIVLSIASLQQTGGHLLGLTIRGESNGEHAVLCLLSGISFLVFFLLDISCKDCFLFMALLHVITGLSWVSNYFYKQLKLYRIL